MMECVLQIHFMEAIMKQFIKAMDDMPFIVKLLLCLPVLDIV